MSSLGDNSPGFTNNERKIQMDRNNASNTQAKGKTNVVMQGQTDSGAYGSDLNAQRRIPTEPKDLTP